MDVLGNVLQHFAAVANGDEWDFQQGKVQFTLRFTENPTLTSTKFVCFSWLYVSRTSPNQEFLGYTGFESLC